MDYIEIHSQDSGIMNTIAHPITGHGCMDDPTTERIFDSSATWVIAIVNFSTCYLSVFMLQC